MMKAFQNLIKSVQGKTNLSFPIRPIDLFTLESTLETEHY